MDRATKTVAVVTNTTSHAAATNTRNAIISAGYASANVTLVAEAGTIPAADVIVIARGILTQELYDAKIAPAFEAGTPVIFGSANALFNTKYISASFARLTGSFQVGETDLTSLWVHNNEHFITAGQALGTGAFYTANNWSFFIPSINEVYASALLRQSETGAGDLVPLEAGHLNLDGVATAARAVLFGNIYGGQSTYTQLGIDLIGNAIEWALGRTESAEPFLLRHNPRTNKVIPVLSSPTVTDIGANCVRPRVTKGY